MSFATLLVRSLFVGAAFTLAGCTNDGDGAPPPQVFFRMTNLAACKYVRVDVDLVGAAAEVRRLADGSPDCTLDPALTQRGCAVDFSLSESGSTLFAQIDDCDVETATLFDCRFSEADVAKLNAATAGRCLCSHEPLCELNGSTCYTTPGICVTEDPSASGCEDCGNHIDDDGDGAIDCDDHECWLECGVGQTTVTCGSSSSTTTSTTIAAVERAETVATLATP